jgi:hypothetical protein
MRLGLGLLMLAAVGVLASIPALAAGVCSTGEYKSCVRCCQTHPTISNRPLCTQQCGDFKVVKQRRSENSSRN